MRKKKEEEKRKKKKKKKKKKPRNMYTCTLVSKIKKHKSKAQPTAPSGCMIVYRSFFFIKPAVQGMPTKMKKRDETSKTMAKSREKTGKP